MRNLIKNQKTLIGEENYKILYEAFQYQNQWRNFMKLPRKSISWLSKHLGITKQMVSKYVYCIVVSFFLWNDPVTYGWSLLQFVQKKPRRPLASRISVGTLLPAAQ